MHIIEDTRNKIGKHEEKNEWFKKNEVTVIRSKVPFGDYTLPPKVAVDTKKDMNEIAQNISVEHKRFVAECVNARDAGCKLYILVENDEGISDIEQVHTWINPQCIYHPKCIQGGRLEKAMKTIQMRYGCTFLFCKPEESAAIITEVLYRGE